MTNKIGVMQGRLLPKYQGRYQAHPVGYWREEFETAKHFGLDCIEFILDLDQATNNPIMKKSGIEEIKSIIDKTGVSVTSVCADFFMDAPIHSKEKSTAELSKALLVQLIKNSKNLEITDIVIPCVDKSSLNSEEIIKYFVKRMMPIVKIAEKFKINLALETDLPPTYFAELVEIFKSDFVTINYDTGNSAALNFNSIDELQTYGSKITSIHIKDRVLGGGPVILGAGATNFSSFFEKLKEFEYQGPFIMQAYRDEEGVKIFKKQLDWIKPFLENYKLTIK